MSAGAKSSKDTGKGYPWFVLLDSKKNKRRASSRWFPHASQCNRVVCSCRRVRGRTAVGRSAQACPERVRDVKKQVARGVLCTIVEETEGRERRGVWGPYLFLDVDRLQGVRICLHASHVFVRSQAVFLLHLNCTRASRRRRRKQLPWSRVENMGCIH